MITVNDFEFRYEGAADRLFHNASLRIESSDIVGVIGPNGAGKTSLFHLLAGGSLPKAQWQGQLEVGAAKNERTVVLQHSWLPSLLTIGELTGFILTLNGYSPAEGIRAFRESLDSLGEERFDSLESRQFGRLSTGERHWFIVVMGLFCSRRLALLDEPTSGLDPAARYRIWESIHFQRSLGKTILVSSHLIDEIGDQVDYFYLIRHQGFERFESTGEFRQKFGGRTSDEAFVRAFYPNLVS